jgi:hypothetical protein
MRKIIMPDSDDVDSTIVALIRIQITYKLTADQLANGIIFEKKVTNRMTGKAGNILQKIFGKFGEKVKKVIFLFKIIFLKQ